ncbi:acyloxyacyl hydrolase [Sinomicrobium weinanense]|uniref:Acyloxyacyl hydrolase n=1 Tax=Sinomicrobium weinanense TaxID=2842200 RepID=A0A926Q217_9FLAO|nr:acyloxyacyl hydrolase [Sinomicrobium weinanense]MBC9796192.1 acyloxyacyl hydrolase [Sinomicrobium weinanense]MBU3123471.1 acyloxyacyl hydrolase [Sinomicrobium weinanense]
MKKVFTVFFILFQVFVSGQEKREGNKHFSYVDASYFYGNIALHNTDIQHLITAHPEGMILGWSRKTFGQKAWEQLYNYPDYGLSFSYQNLKNEYLGKNYGLYAHYNFYFFNRNLMLRVGQGLAYTTDPYDKEENYRNIAFGSQIMSSTYLMLNYKKERILDRLGLQAGFSLIHYSNANVKAPNTSINSITFNVGVNYQLDEEQPEFIRAAAREKFTEPVRYNMVFRSGVNESDIVDSGQYPFYIFSFYADKRLSRKSAVQLGTEVFYSNFLKEYIKFKSIAYPEDGISGREDYKRTGIFAGHELFVNKLSLVTQLGYYLYYPVDFEGRFYQRIGLKYYISPKLFGALTLKTHAAKAEAVEFGVGIRF